MYDQLQKALCYRFRDPALLRGALTHSSYANENKNLKLECNERLEFLGDSILGFVVADALYRRFPDRPEGEMTRMRADMVCEAALARAANEIGLGQELLLGRGSTGEEPQQSEEEKRQITNRLNTSDSQKIYFSYLEHAALQPLNEAAKVFSLEEADGAFAFCGIGNPKPFVEELKRRYHAVDFLPFGDHHAYNSLFGRVEFLF